MRTGKFFTAVTMLCLCFFIMQPVQASVKETGTELTTQVPDEHLVSLDIGEHGAVTADGKKYTGKQEIKVGRLKEQLYQIKPDSGYQADKVQYGDKTVQLTGSSYTAEAIHQDGLTLKVTFKKEKAAASGSGKNSSSGSTAAKTGDTAEPAGWILALLLSGAGFLILTGREAGRRKE